MYRLNLRTPRQIPFPAVYTIFILFVKFLSYLSKLYYDFVFKSIWAIGGNNEKTAGAAGCHVFLAFRSFMIFRAIG